MERFENDRANWKQEDINIEDWAWESPLLAETTACGLLVTAVPVQQAAGELADCVSSSSPRRELAWR